MCEEYGLKRHRATSSVATMETRKRTGHSKTEREREIERDSHSLWKQKTKTQGSLSNSNKTADIFTKTCPVGSVVSCSLTGQRTVHCNEICHPKKAKEFTFMWCMF